MRFFPCARCGQKLQVAEDLRNMLLRCPLCTAEMPHPDAERPEPVVLTLLPEAPARPAVAAVAPRPALPPTADGPGRVVREFRGTGAWTGVGIFAGTLVLGVLVTVLGGVSKSGPLAAVGMVVVIFSLIAAGVLAIRALRALGARIQVCEHGLICAPPRGGARCLWSDVTAVVYQKRMLGAHATANFGLLGYLFARLTIKRTLILRRRDGEPLRLPEDVRGVHETYEIVCEQVRPWLLAALEQALDQGHVVAFGEHLEVDGHGVRWVGKRLVWDDVDRVRLQFAANLGCVVLQVVAPSKPPDIELDAIDNLDLLLEIVERRFGVRVDRGKDVLS